MLVSLGSDDFRPVFRSVTDWESLDVVDAAQAATLLSRPEGVITSDAYKQNKANNYPVINLVLFRA